MSLSQRASLITIDIIVGVIFVLFNFNGLIRHIANARLPHDSTVQGLLITVSLFPKQMLGTSTDVLYTWMIICFVGLWIYLGFVLLLSITQRRPSLTGYGVLGLTAGTLSLALLSWAGWLVAWILTFLFMILRFIGHILLVIMDFLARMFVYALPVLAVVALLVAVVWAWKTFGARAVLLSVGVSLLLYVLYLVRAYALPVLACIVLLGAVIWAWKAFGPRIVLLSAAAGLVLYFLAPLLRAFYRFILPFLLWVRDLLVTIFVWVFFVVKWLLHAGLIVLGCAMLVGVIGSIGRIVVDQLKTAWESGRSHKGVLLGSFSLGASLALILLASAGKPDTPVVPAQTTAVAASVTQDQHPAKRQRKKRATKRATKAPTAPVPVAIPSPPPAPSFAVTVDRAWQRSSPIFKQVSATQVFMATLPNGIMKWAQGTFTSTNAPTFDATLLALIIGLSIIGLLRGVFASSEVEFRIKFYNSDLVALAAIPVLVVLLFLAASEANQD